MFDLPITRRVPIQKLAATTILATLSACSGGRLDDVTAVGQVASNYRTSDYATAGVGLDMWVVVLGAVADGDQQALIARTLSAMQRHADITTRFATVPQNYNREYKTVMVFNGPSNLQADVLCGTPHQHVTTLPGDTLRIQAVFCRDDQFISEVYSEARGGNSLRNPNFDALIRQTMITLYAAPREEQRSIP